MSSRNSHSRRFIILTSGGGELANQLWNFISVYAYALYEGALVSNPSFFEYHRYFQFLKTESFTARFFSFWFQSAHTQRRGHPIHRLWRTIYTLYAKISIAFHSSSLCSSENTQSKRTYLPPSADAPCAISDTTYFLGWLFRNPQGLDLYREKLLEVFKPSRSVQKSVLRVTTILRADSKIVIGIHYRQGDYAIFKGGIYLLSATRIREIVDEYLSLNSLSPRQVQLCIASDGPVDSSAFTGYDVYISKENAPTDLFVLASCDVVIGSNSSFGHFASWYGNIPHIVAEQGVMDWDYYSDKKTYFPNKYATLANL